MTDTVELVERHPHQVGSGGIILGLSGPKLAAWLGSSTVLALWMVTHIDTATILMVMLAEALLAGAFLGRIFGSKETLVDILPRALGFCSEVTAGNVDIHFREIESRHYTHRTLPADTPMSVHLGHGMFLSSFPWREQHVGLIGQGGTRWRPWRLAHMVVIQLAGREPMLLESPQEQERLIALYVNMLDTLTKPSLGLSGIQQLVMSRPLVQGEGGHWLFRDLLNEQPVEWRRRCEDIQLAHDRNGAARRQCVVLRTGGTFATWFKARHRGSSRAGVEEDFRKVLDKLPGVAAEADLTLVRIFDQQRLASLLRGLVDPSYAPALSYREKVGAVRPVPTHIAPITEFEKHRTFLVVNGVYTRTFRVTGWPAVTRGPSFLGAALLNYPRPVRWSVVMVPEDKRTSVYVNTARMTAQAAKADKKAKNDQVTTESDRQAQAEPRQRDVEIANGHHPLEYAVYLTVEAEDEKGLRLAGDELATFCDVAGVEIDVCKGREFQAAAYTYTMPFVRGV